MAEITVGARGEQKLLVTTEVAIDFLGLPEARVLSTPQMIRYMEWTCRNTAMQFLDAGHDTVGTKVCISHLAAAPIGSVVVFTSEITAVDKNRVSFKVAARTEQDLIGEGTHERAVINIAKFATRLAEKAQKKS